MKKLLLAIGILGFASAPALSAPTVDFATADANGDGQVTMEEATGAGLTWSAEEFAALDTDQSGALSEEEYKVAG